ncbi:MAG: hypothetical protein A2X86_14870 [Bdellovibrionales bacterium GWA2_49_15]|nr:MAG: hypothetical protein A2X86_14870 [Bdellovibrionales bacterium GWA2_49_15]HAZ13377.1 hypothetical protein [Bdellovibrionales bacterium]
MNLKLNSKNSSNEAQNFAELTASHLAYLGGNITPHLTSPTEYIDLEEFFVEATNAVFSDTRLTRCLEYWISRYGKYLSPSKIRTVLGKTKYDPRVLGYFIELIDGEKFKHGPFKILSSFIKRGKKSEPLFSHLPRPKVQGAVWKKYGLIAPLFNREEEEKNLKHMSYIVRNVPELKYRIMGMHIPVADILAYLDRNGEASLYRIAKETNTAYSRVHRVYQKHVRPCQIVNL